MHKRFFLLLPVMALAACSGGAKYPSLAQRPAELAYAQGDPVPANLPPGTPDPATLRQIASLRADAAHAHAGFAHSAEEAEHLAKAAQGSPVGSEPWAAATTAMAALDSARNATSLALADLDALRARTAVSAAAANAPSDQATYAAAADADSAVAAMLSDEDNRIAALHRSEANAKVH